MKVTSITEREFLNSIIAKNKRLDGRNLVDGRTLSIKFLQEWGGCIVYLGNTIVLAQVSSEVVEPKAVSPTEGALHINFEPTPMSAPDVNTSRSSSEFIELQRSLERCVRDSKCIDLESLCIVAGSKVWAIRVDIHTLNDDGNVLECASIAAISALAHFKRPDVTVIGTEVTVHSLDDREPVPLNLHHMPISINLALFDQGTYILVDPIEAEERIADGCYVIGMNAHQEMCFVHRRGCLLLHENTIQKCEKIAIRRAQVITQGIRAALDDDSYKRATKAPVGFVNLLQTGTILGATQPIYNFDVNSVKIYGMEDESDDESKSIEVVTVDKEKTPKTYPVGVSAAKERAKQILKNSEATIFEGGPSKWRVESESDSTSDEEVSAPPESTSLKQENLSSEEEEETGFIEADQVDVKPSSSRGWFTKNPFS
ncbi:exosome complex component RRP45 [Trichonephila inaurata madagascariensis]|uniref:Exosome complex component RRP45 n=1 Tax=Trichonephila inaurata madagascariensis TaxID=2747483 RepID=A0A8X6YD91_9ARAC|nr:exosome complex component RRP45 [Trichonephila inaurata madagascariensis]